MDEKDWTILQTIYEEKNVTRAAQKLYTSQPALSYRLSQIEEQIGIKILVRSKKETSFTREGELLVQYAKKMTVELRKFKEQIQNIKGKVDGELRIGGTSNFVNYDLPIILKQFHNAYPNVQFKVNSDMNTFIYEQLINKEYHIGIIRGELDWNHSRVLLKEDEICLFSREEINFSNLPSYPRIVNKLDPEAKKFDERWWQDHFSVPPYISMEVDKSDTCKQMVMQGLGYCILPRYIFQEEISNKELFILPLTQLDGTPITRKLWALYREEDLEFITVKTFLDFLKQYYNVDNDNGNISK
jgi:DNA-binding transcriptional LysR family regulator